MTVKWPFPHSADTIDRIDFIPLVVDNTNLSQLETIVSNWINQGDSTNDDLHINQE